jgi:pyrroloquinoline quinone biosynthesis protein B
MDRDARRCGRRRGLRDASAVGDGVGRRDWRLVSLGCAQDAGFPHLGCFKPCCERARAEGRRESVAALAVESVESGDWWLVDATPDLPAQIHSRGRLPKGILLTHAHIGHYTGLMYLGREGMGARGMSVYASRRMARFLTDNAPWSQLVALGNIRITTFDDGVPFDLGPGMRVVPHAVPHRNEFADTHAFAFEDALYVPDIDRREDWRTETMGRGDFRRPWEEWKTLIVDGTFFDGAELPDAI